ncbi:flagellin [Histidinibacterium aquaticum]|uniref:Flagellin n=1 Tax=Histidinibacterium aquaticum TaxID=2613962 RepID=A0A5J5GNT4_9RHOB|nr:flagellin [Histidinibacterium aquaticum]KAA9009969.1 hypothetical protein F3S47_01515 [Histidinibacterium aquaticum]
MPVISNPAPIYSQLTSLRHGVAVLRERLDTAGQEVASGKRTDIYGALGSGAGELIELHAMHERQVKQIDTNKVLAARMDAMSAVMGSVRTMADEVRAAALGVTSAGASDNGALKAAAASALDRILGQLNTSHSGTQLFSGIETAVSPMTAWDEAHPVTGLVPSQVIDGVIGGGVVSAADATAKAAELAQVFDGTALPAARTYEETFYSGAPLLDGGGVPVPRQSARIDEGVTLDYGVQANDPAFRDIYRGLAMLAATDATEIPDAAARQTWMEEALGALSSGLDGLLEAEARLGGAQKGLDETIALLESRRDLYAGQIGAMENVDPYEAATRLTELETRLEASYLVTRRLSEMSFLKFM